MLELLDWKSRSQVQAHVRTLVEQGDLAGATTVITDFIAQSGDESLTQAASASEAADVDWVEVCAD